MPKSAWGTFMLISELGLVIMIMSIEALLRYLSYLQVTTKAVP